MTLRDLVVSFGYDVDKNSERKAESSIQGIKNMAKKLLGSIAVVFSVQGISNLAQAAADAEALKSQFSQVFGNMEAEATESLQSVADEAGALTNRMKGSFTQIAAFTKTTGATEAEALEIAERGMRAVADSAAFYDRSLENVTASLQSFLKGNFENDAALGLSCTETTRNTAANELYGKSFKDLSEYQKQLTLLKMVEDANKLSGALGQASRESDTWTNQLGNFKQSLIDLKAAAGSTFLKPAVAVLKLLTKLVQGATKAINSLTTENGLLTRATERYHALVKRLQPAIDRMTQTLRNGITKGKEVVKSLVEKLGGIETILKVAAIAAAAFIIAMNWGSIISGAKKFVTLLSGIGKMFNPASLKIMAIVAAVVILVLLIEDFVNFLLGNDSVIGTFFDKAGIGADNARKKIFNAWNKIKDFLVGVWNFLKEAVGMWVDTVTNFFKRHADSIRKNFERAWGLVKTFLSGVWTFISQLAAVLFGDTEESIDGSQKSTKDKILSIWQNILNTLSAIWDALYKVASAVFNAVATIIEVVFEWIKAFWNKWGDKILSWFKKLWNNLGKVLNGFLDVLEGVANFISAVFSGDWKSAWEAIKQVFSGVWEAIGGILSQIWSTICLTLEMGLSAISSLWETVWNAISSFFIGVWNGIVNFFAGVVSVIMGIISPITDFFVGVFQAAWDGICAVFSGVAAFFQGVWDSIVTIFTSIGVTIADAISGAVKGAINTVLSGAAGIINGFISAINLAIDVINSIPGVSIGKLSELEVPMLAKGGIATEATKAIVGEGSEPEAIMPLSKLGAMISGYIKMAKESDVGQAVSSMINNVVGALTTCVSAFSRAATPSAETASNSTTTNSNSNVVQNVEINNSYSGGERETQKNVSKAMNKSAEDATTEMARALAYTRG